MNRDLLVSHAAFVRRVARSLVTDAHSAEDLAQDTLARVLERRVHEPASARGWLARVARRLAFNLHRGESRRRRREREFASPEALPSADESVEREQVLRQVVDTVLELDEPYRSTVILRFYEDLVPAEISRRQGTSVNTVNTRLRRAREQLRRQLKDVHGGDDRGLVLALWPLAARGPWSAGGATSVASLATSSGPLGVKLLMTAKTAVILILAMSVIFAVAVGTLPWWTGQVETEGESSVVVAENGGSEQPQAVGVPRMNVTEDPPEDLFPGESSEEEEREESLEGLITRGFVEVRVTRHGAPLPGCPVTLLQDPMQGEREIGKGETDRSGQIRFARCIHSRYLARCTWESVTTETMVERNSTTTIAFDQAPLIEVLIEDHRGSPVKSALVEAVPQTDLCVVGTARTDSDGLAQVAAMSFPLVLYASNGSASTHAALDRNPERQPVTLRLSDTVQVRGTVQTRGGEPIGNARVVAGKPRIEVSCDEAGAFSISLSFDSSPGIWVSAPGYATRLLMVGDDGAEAGSRDPVDVGAICLDDTEDMRILVTDTTGAPLGGARVTLEKTAEFDGSLPARLTSIPLGSGLESAQTNEEGIAVFHVRERGGFLFVQCPGHAWTRTSVDRTSEGVVKVALAPGRTITVQVIASGEAIESATWKLVLVPEQSEFRRRQHWTMTRTGVDTWTAFGFRPGRYRLHVTSNVFVSKVEEVEVSDQDATIPILMETGGVVSGVVTLRDEPVPFALVYARITETEGWWDTRCDEHGKFHLTGVPMWDSRCLVQAWAEVQGVKWKSAAQAPAEDCVLELSQSQVNDGR